MKKYVVGMVRIKEERLEQAIDAFKLCRDRVKEAEPNISWEMRQCEDDPTLFINIETFPDQAALDFHMHGEHTQQNFALMEEFLDGEPEIHFCSMTAET